ncbi:MAG TPA: uroporphyrinogen decarboxylase family protein [Phycisphaerae bacterium]|nr:uroporphyrinogen decarboxylase family protein [Phycisphaerae bacterium]
MTARQRYIETLTFGSPDRIPFQPGGGRKSTRARWHGEGLPEAKSPITHVMELLGIEPDRTDPPVRLDVDFRMIPQFEEKTLEHKNGHYVVQDWKGNICEISDEYDVTYLREAIDFVTRRWISCPVETRDDWEQMKTRYDVDAPGRFPADFSARCETAKQRDYVLSFRFSGPFWQMREWCGFEGLCILMAEQPEFVEEMAEFWTDFVSRMLERILAHVVPDSVGFNEDMAYKAKAMISPEMTRRFCKPSWDRWTRQLRSAGVPLIDMDSDGFIGELIPIWIGAGINVCDPIEVAAHNDIVEFRHRFGHQMAYTGGVDKRAMAKGGRVLRDELRRIEPVVRDGGYIPGCDHGVPADVSWPNFVDYCRLLAQMTGWL